MTTGKKPLARQVLLATTAIALGSPCTAIVAQGSTLLEEVIVTARKKEESLQDVPVAVSAVTSSMIEDLNINGLEDIAKLTAGMLYDNDYGRNSNRPVIRGQANIQGSSGVAYFIDGVYVNTTLGGYDLNEVERVEIIKGPQSALYGRNTYSGAINIITKSPGDEPSADIKVELAEDGQREMAASARGPLIPGVLGGGISARHFDMDGAFDNKYDGSDIGEQESKSVSGVLEYTPREDLRIRARAYYEEMDDGQIAMFSQAASANNCYFDDGSLYQGGGRYYCGKLKAADVSTDWRRQVPGAGDSVDSLQTSLIADWDINDDWSLTSITGYSRTKQEQKLDGDYSSDSFQVANFTPSGFPYAGFPVPPFAYGYVGTMVDFSFAGKSDEEDFSQELRLNYEREGLRALLGAYYYDQNRGSRSIRNLPEGAADRAAGAFMDELARMQALCEVNPVCESMTPFFGPTVAVSRDREGRDIENTAIFGLISYELADGVTLTAEGRYQNEDIEQRVILRNLDEPVSQISDAKESFDKFLPRVTLDWRLNDDTLLYVLYAEGTKPGGFNGPVAVEAGRPTYDEEESKSFEIGAKNVFDEGRMQLNLAAYYNDLSGYQMSQNVRSGGNTLSAIVNAGDAHIKGLEAEFFWQPEWLEGLNLRANYAWTDTEFSSGVDENQGVLNDVADDGLANCSLGDQFLDDDDCTPAYGSIDGKEIPRTAEHQAFFDVEYSRMFSQFEGWRWRIGANYAFESSKYGQVHNLIETGDMSMVNARIGFSNERYDITIWGKNLTGEDSPTAMLRYADANDSFKRSFVGMSRRDTYFGATFTAHF